MYPRERSASQVLRPGALRSGSQLFFSSARRRKSRADSVIRRVLSNESFDSESVQLRTDDVFVSAGGHPLKQLANEFTFVNLVLAADFIPQLFIAVALVEADDGVRGFKLNVIYQLTAARPTRDGRRTFNLGDAQLEVGFAESADVGSRFYSAS